MMSLGSKKILVAAERVNSRQMLALLKRAEQEGFEIQIVDENAPNLDSMRRQMILDVSQNDEDSRLRLVKMSNSFSEEKQKRRQQMKTWKREQRQKGRR